MLKGVKSTSVGYANGDTINPSYEDLKSGRANHAETVKIIYDNREISLSKIIEHFLRFVDPYSLNKQGGDEGIRYRSGVYYTDENDCKIIVSYFKKVLKPHYKIEVLPLHNHYEAEYYHQNYLVKNPGGYCHVNLDLLGVNELK